MPVYEYEAQNLKGELLKGKLEAIDDNAVKVALREKSYYPIKVKLYSPGFNIDIGSIKKVPIKDIAVFARQLSVVINAGINILKALQITNEQTENKKLKSILVQVQNDVEKGNALSDAMAKHKDFPDMLVNMIAVGEASGTLDKVLSRMADYYDKEYRLHQKIKQSTTYPKVIVIFALIVVTLLVTKVLPTFVGMITSSNPNASLPLPTAILLGLSNAIKNFWYLFIIVIAGIIIGYKKYAATEEGSYKIDKLKIEIPKLGTIYKKIVTARFARTFGSLMACGVPIIQSISICSDIVGNKLIGKILKEGSEDIKKGMTLSNVLAANPQIFPQMLIQMIKIGEESGTMDSILENTAEFYDSEVETATAQLTTMIEPIIIILLAVVVGFIILSMILPIIDSYSTAGGM